ncbi:hypothetical protein KJ665_04105, partial [Patescibacteria group bacterium]|nr:hypothetical protein [Patescibacteria group bacterium]
MTEKNKAIKILNKLEQSERDDGEIIHLTANESVMSPLANRWQSSILNTRYALGSAEGRNGKKFNLFKKNFISKNINGFDELKTLAENACQKLFYCESSEFRTLSGLHGMISIIGSLTSPGDLIVTLPSQYVGHFTTVSLLKRMGRKNILLPYSSDKFELDLDGLKKIAKNNKIK